MGGCLRHGCAVVSMGRARCGAGGMVAGPTLLIAVILVKMMEDAEQIMVLCKRVDAMTLWRMNAKK